VRQARDHFSPRYTQRFGYVLSHQTRVRFLVALPTPDFPFDANERFYLENSSGFFCGNHERPSAVFIAETTKFQLSGRQVKELGSYKLFQALNFK
jgi:hypothetical protein